MKCLILAGGFARRLGPLTANKAKALLEFKGKPVISHVVSRVPPHVDVLVSTNKKFEADFIAWSKTLDRPVEICVEEAVTEEEKKGAVGAIDFWICSKGINEDLLVIAADNYFEFDLSDLIGRFNGRNVIIAAHDVGDKDKACEIGRICQIGLMVVREHKVVRFFEKPPKATSSLVATGIYIMPPRVFPLLSLYCREAKRDNLGSFVSYLLGKREEVDAQVFAQTWLDVGDQILRGLGPSS